MFIPSVRLEADTLYQIGPHIYTATQLETAVLACASIARTYAIANEDNGGGSRSIQWDSLDAAAELADQAMGPRMQGIHAWAKKENA